MKVFKYLFFVGICMSLTFCETTDDTDTPDDTTDDGGVIISPDSTENAILEADVVADGISINGATRITDAPPTPTGSPSFTLQNTTSAVRGEGFNIVLDSQTDIVGAYLIITGKDGTPAGSYFDIPQSSFNSDFTGIDREDIHMRSAQIEGESSIDVDFNSSIPAGEFCYQLCVYDAAGNISNPQEVCVTIQEWGGNSDLVGTWGFTSFTEGEDGETDTITPGQSLCYDDELFCANGDMLTFESCFKINTLRFVFNSDGTYTLLEEAIDEDIDYEASLESCSIVDEDDSAYTFISQGQWAYNESNGRLAVVSFYEEFNEDGDIETDTYPAGEGDLLFDAAISISGDTFTITEDDTDGYTFSIDFKKQ